MPMMDVGVAPIVALGLGIALIYVALALSV